MAQDILVIVVMLFIATVAAIIFRRINFPYTIGLVLVGLVLALICTAIGINTTEIQLTPDIIMYVLLPVLIFESAVHIDTRMMIKTLGPTMILAAPGLVISTFAVGFILHWAVGLELGPAMLFGALISATDPVAVIGLFKELGAPKRLTMLVDGESLFNDATAIVMFNIVKGIVFSGAALNFATLLNGAASFCFVFFAGLLVGATVGLLMIMVIRLTGNDPLMTVALTTIVAYTSFIVADRAFEVSGVMSAVGAGIVISYYGSTRFIPEVKTQMNQFWEFASFVANSFIFLMLGFTQLFMVKEMGHYTRLLQHIGWAVLAIQIARAIIIFGICPFLGKIRKADAVSWRYQLVMFWGGLRGAVPMALVLSLPADFAYRDEMIAVTLGVVLFTLVVQGTTVRCLMHRLKLDQPDPLTMAAEAFAVLSARVKGLSRLKLAAETGHFPEKIIAEFQAEYQAKRDTAQQELNLIRAENNRQDNVFRKNMWMESLSIAQTNFNQLLDHGVISPVTWRRLNFLIENDMEMVYHEGVIPTLLRTHGFNHSPGGWLLLHLRYLLPPALSRRLHQRLITSNVEKALALLITGRKILNFTDEMIRLFPENAADIAVCRDAYKEAIQLASRRLNQIRDRNSEQLELVMREIVRRVILDGEIEELETMDNNGIIPDNVASSLIAEVRCRIEKSIALVN